MQSEVILQAIYRKVFNTDLNYNEFSHRMNIQKVLYILQKMGLDVGNYGFSWYKHGPYSQSLQEDAYLTLNSKYIDLEFTNIANQQIEILKDSINSQSKRYTTTEWLEAVASIHYIKTRFLPFSTDSEILEDLVRRKPHLNDGPSNKSALKFVNTNILKF